MNAVQGDRRNVKSILHQLFVFVVVVYQYKYYILT